MEVKKFMTKYANMENKIDLSFDLQLPDASGVKLKKHYISLKDITRLSEKRLAMFQQHGYDSDEKRLRNKVKELFIL